MGRKDDDSLWLDSSGDLFANRLELSVDRMLDIVHDTGLWRSVNPKLKDRTLRGRDPVLRGPLTPPCEKKYTGVLDIIGF